MPNVCVMKDGLYLDGNKTRLLSGDFHYFRTLPDGWNRRLRLMKEFGLTAVTTYVPWNMHEPRKGQFCFEGIADLPRFLQLAQENELYVVLRMSPYMCAEWEMGGLPWWLLRNRQLTVRSSDPAYLRAVFAYNRVLCEKVRPYLYTNGGPVILVGLENEYGSFGNDEVYLRKLAQNYRKNGIDVPLISANGVDPFKFLNGTLPENWNGVDAQTGPGGLHDLVKLQEMHLDKPLMAGEAWLGHIQFCEKPFGLNEDIEVSSEYFRQALQMGAAINFYMFVGGTNFGFTAGSLDHPGPDGTKIFQPLVTSYDYDAPISEEGTPREKYFALRDVLDAFLGQEPRPHIVPDHPVQSIPSITLSSHAPLLPQMNELASFHAKLAGTRCMEDLGQASGFICYTTHLKVADDRTYHLRLEGLADRATVYLNGKYIGTMMRDRHLPEITFTVPENGADLTLLVENMGRVDYGYHIYDRKGLSCVRFEIEQPNGEYLWNLANCTGFDTVTLPLDNTDGLIYGSDYQPNCPAFHRGTFTAQPGVDTFLDMTGWQKGVVYINGFNLGRYWTRTPQRTLYIPGELLKEENTLEILELHNPPADFSVRCISHSRLCEPIQSDFAEVRYIQN